MVEKAIDSLLSACGLCDMPWEQRQMQDLDWRVEGNWEGVHDVYEIQNTSGR